MLAGAVDLHPGLIVLRSRGLTREEQWEWVEPVLRWIQEMQRDLVNRGRRSYGTRQVQRPPSALGSKNPAMREGRFSETCVPCWRSTSSSCTSLASRPASRCCSERSRTGLAGCVHARGARHLLGSAAVAQTSMWSDLSRPKTCHEHRRERGLPSRGCRCARTCPETDDSGQAAAVREPRYPPPHERRRPGGRSCRRRTHVLD